MNDRDGGNRIGGCERCEEREDVARGKLEMPHFGKGLNVVFTDVRSKSGKWLISIRFGRVTNMDESVEKIEVALR